MSEEKKPQLHVSGVSMTCMEAFRRRYIEREIIPPGVALIVGTATHKSVAGNLQNKIDKGELLPLDAVADLARDGLNVAWQGGVKLDDEEVSRGVKAVRGEAVDKAVRLSKLHAAEKAAEIEPTRVERSWAIEIPGYSFDLVGTLDIQEGESSVRDTKTSGKTPPEDTADKSIQLTAYAMAVQVIDGKAPAKVKLDYLIDTKTPKSLTLESTRGPDDYAGFMARVDAVAQAMQTGTFVPVEPSHWCCDPKWCGYFATCRYVRRPKQFAS